MKSLFLISLMTGLLVAGPVFADKPDKGNKDKGGHRVEESHRGNSKHADNRRDDRREDSRRGQHDDSQGRSYLNDQHRAALHQYYDDRYHASGRCPPGLAKKNNGCQPPGQAKKWRKGQPLARDVIYYNLPRDLLERMPSPPTGHRYVRVAADILLIAIGTGMVVDAIDNLGNR
jgi:Ni/Co efflux regulator RcnB